MKNREELERLIVDASDGLLNSNEVENLEKKLQNYPDLYRDYKSIMNLPDLGNIYQAEMDVDHHQPAIHKIKRGIRDLSYSHESFEIITLNWFRRYALAASLVIFAVTSIFTLQQHHEQLDGTDGEEMVEEYFYPVEDYSVADSYILNLEELPEE